MFQTLLFCCVGVGMSLAIVYLEGYAGISWMIKFDEYLIKNASGIDYYKLHSSQFFVDFYMLH